MIVGDCDGDCDCDCVCGRGGGGGGVEQQIYVGIRRVSFMYFIVDKRIFLSSAKFTVGCPYRYRCDWFPKRFRLYFCRICITLLAKVAL